MSKTWGTHLSRAAAKAFADKWSSTKSEKQFAQSFWSDFFHNVVGVPDLLNAGIEFEYPVKVVDTKTTNFIDVLWGGIVLIEHKSAGKSLDVAEAQARNYLVSLPTKLRPPIILVSDFAHVRIVDVLLATTFEFQLNELSSNLHRLEAIFAAHGRRAAIEEVTADKKAVEKMGNIYLALEKQGYAEHSVSVFLVRILFLLFGDDTDMWKRNAFKDVVDSSPEDGKGLGGRVNEVFARLADVNRYPVDNEIAPFPYVNGGLFEEVLPPFNFDKDSRQALYAACEYEWSDISPAIFGAMFQQVKSKEARREFGEHYTSEANILKVIRPLFLDDYLSRLRKVWDDRNELRKLKKDLGAGHYLDPAAGSSNFLIVTYKRLRDIEHKIIARLIELEGKVTQSGAEGVYGLQVGLDGTIGLSVHLEQFHAIEYDEWSSQIGRVAMWLADHQLNLALEELTGSTPNRFPLTHSADIHKGNALRTDWGQFVKPDDNLIIMGNPPFYGSSRLNSEQKVDQELVWGGVSGSGDLDYVANWYLVAARLIEGTQAKAAFVSTNSITQGQQPPLIWGHLEQLGMGIDFAHRTFAWSNDAAGQAAVHCVIIGFSSRPKPTFRPLWSYETVKSEPAVVRVRNINAYLLDAPSVLVTARTRPFDSATQIMEKGNIPADGGFLSKINPEEAEAIRREDPIAAKYLRRLVGAWELIHDDLRYCLWLVDADPNDLVRSPELMKRVKAVREMREASPKAKTREDAKRATEFQEIRQPRKEYLAIPLHSSEDRDYVPIGRVSPEVIANNALSVVNDASLLTFGILQSRPFNVWLKAVSGRIKNDPRISNTITYNNFVFPDLTESSVQSGIETAAQAILDVRHSFPNSSLATLYHRLAMPAALRKAHEALDKAVLNSYGLKANATDIGILEKLFGLYAEMTDGLLAVSPAKKKRRARPGGPVLDLTQTEE